MSTEWTAWAWRQELPPDEKLLLLSLADHAVTGDYRIAEGKHTLSAWDLDVPTTRQRTGLTEPQIDRAYTELERKGILVRYAS